MSGSLLVGIVLVVSLLAVGRHLTMANPLQEVDTEEGQLTECSTNPEAVAYLLVPEEGCYYVDTSFNRRLVSVATPGDVITYSGKCGVTEDGDIVVPSGQDCIFEDNEDTYTMFVNVVKESEGTADEEGDENGSSTDYEAPEDEYGVDFLLRYAIE